MGRDLQRSAQKLGCSERTLRRYAHDGLLRARRLNARRLELPASEEEYLEHHWALLTGLRRALRTERDVRLAVLFGSTATGQDSADSDLDVLVVHRRAGARALADLKVRLRRALGRQVHVVSLEQAETSPSLLADVVEEGRVIIDRDRRWSALHERLEDVRAEAAVEDEPDDNAGAQGDRRRPGTRVTDRPSKGRRRIHTLLQLIPAAREQLLVAMDEFPPLFDCDAFVRAAQSPDARERNKVAVIEREYEVLLNCVDELAARASPKAAASGWWTRPPARPWSIWPRSA